jgi:hypothetical protein
MIWAYFNNCADLYGAECAIRAIARPIYHDVGATIPT